MTQRSCCSVAAAAVAVVAHRVAFDIGAVTAWIGYMYSLRLLLLLKLPGSHAPL
jgi:hypothetical protein